MPTDIEIARAARLQPIGAIAAEAGIPEEALHPYGKHIAKVDTGAIPDFAARPDGKLILVTAISPTPAGEGKTTTTVGLGDGLRRLGKRTMIALREPSLGPCFGQKGGAAGGGHAQVVPMEQINLHFTGDFHAITSAHNLLAAMLDNHVYWGNGLDFDTRHVAWRRVLDMNDRALRAVVSSLGGAGNGFPREDGFDITVASEVMAILCLAMDLKDLERRLGNIVVGYTRDRKPVKAADLKGDGAMTVLLKDALMPNLVQTLENNPVFIHGGPFANIAHGCNSVLATKTALKLADYVVTEAGFGADLGAEKFFDIKCRKAGLSPAAAVVVVPEPSPAPSDPLEPQPARRPAARTTATASATVRRARPSQGNTHRRSGFQTSGLPVCSVHSFASSVTNGATWRGSIGWSCASFPPDPLAGTVCMVPMSPRFE